MIYNNKKIFFNKIQKCIIVLLKWGCLAGMLFILNKYQVINWNSYFKQF